MKLKSFTAFLLLAFLASCSGSDKAKNESAKEDNVPTVKVEQVSEQDVDQIQTYSHCGAVSDKQYLGPDEQPHQGNLC